MTAGANEHDLEPIGDVSTVDELEIELGPLQEVLAQRAVIEHVLLDIVLLVRERDGRILDANHAAIETYGYARPALLGMTIWQIRSPETHLAIRSQLNAANVRGELFETTHVKRDGTTVLVEVRSQGCMFRGERVLLSIVRDITERRRNERLVLLLKQTIDQMSAAAFWQDRRGRFVYVNAAACQSLGYSRGELEALTVSDVNPRATPANMAALWEDIQRGRKEMHRSESIHRRKDGTEFPVEISSVFVPFGAEEYICGFARDLTDVRRAESERRRLEEDLRHAQKVQALGVLVGGIAHDLNNILTPIVVNVDALADACEHSATERPLIDEILAATTRASDLIRRLLTFGRRSTTRLGRCDLTTVVTEAQKLMRPVIATTAIIDFAPVRCSANVEGDSNQLHQVVVNLLLNAADALAGASGHVRITIDSVELDDSTSAMHPLAHPGHYVRLSVNDTGTGIDDETLDHIFEPFFTTKEVGKGTGLGLSVVHEIVTGHGGFVTVRTKQGQGTTFAVFIPASESSGPPRIEAPHESLVPLTMTRVLLVDDDEQVLLSIARMLEGRGLVVTAVPGAVEAVAVLAKAPDSFDVVLVDMLMPRMSGLDFASVVSKVKPGLGVVLMSGNLQTIDRSAAQSSGIVGFVEKPPRSSELLAALARATAKGNL